MTRILRMFFICCFVQIHFSLNWILRVNSLEIKCSVKWIVPPLCIKTWHLLTSFQVMTLNFNYGIKNFSKVKDFPHKVDAPNWDSWIRHWLNSRPDTEIAVVGKHSNMTFQQVGNAKINGPNVRKTTIIILYKTQSH